MGDYNTIGTWCNQAISQLQHAGISSAFWDATALVSATAAIDRCHLLANPNIELSKEQTTKLTQLLSQRLAHVPLAYLLGFKEFWSLQLKVNSYTLIPRPDTELLVEAVLTKVADDTTILELGTGSGAISLALAHERRSLRITATDICPQALMVAKFNQSNLQLTNIEWQQGDWYKPVVGNRYACIISNPPYLSATEPCLTNRHNGISYEPRLALVANNNGLGALRTIIYAAPEFLQPDGWLLIEHGYNQGASCRQHFHVAGFTHIKTLCDLAHIERVTIGQLTANS